MEELEEGEIEASDTGDRAREVMTCHRLENKWTLWFDIGEQVKYNPTAKSQQPSSWGANLTKVYTFDTVEQFWGLYNNIRHPSKLAGGADISCFKHNIEPKWEDPICANGGKWGLNFSREKSDIPWLYTLLAMIGEQFDHGEEICGAVVNIRGKQERVGLWTKNAENEVAQVSIGRQWKKILDFKDSIGFIVHDDAKKNGRGAKNRYIV